MLIGYMVFLCFRCIVVFETFDFFLQEHESTEKKLAELQQQMTESSNNLQAEKVQFRAN